MTTLGTEIVQSIDSPAEILSAAARLREVGLARSNVTHRGNEYIPRLGLRVWATVSWKKYLASYSFERG